MSDVAYCPKCNDAVTVDEHGCLACRRRSLAGVDSAYRDGLAHLKAFIAQLRDKAKRGAS